MCIRDSSTSIYRGRAKTLGDDCIDLAEVNHVQAIAKRRARWRLPVIALATLASVALLVFGWETLRSDSMARFLFNMFVATFNIGNALTINAQQKFRSKRFKKKISKFRTKFQNQKQLGKRELLLET